MNKPPYNYLNFMFIGRNRVSYWPFEELYYLNPLNFLPVTQKEIEDYLYVKIRNSFCDMVINGEIKNPIKTEDELFNRYNEILFR